MNAITQSESAALSPRSASAGALLMDGASMERLERLGTLMASGKVSVPAHLRGSTGDCFAIALQSMQWGMNPFAVAQKTFLVSGVLGYEAQLVAAVINSSSAVHDRFHFEWFGAWEKIVGKFKEVESKTKKDENGNAKKYIVPAWQQADEQGLGVRVWATIKGESTPRVLELLMTQARTRNSTLWTEDPKQQIAYLAQKRWARLFTPDVILGVYTPDELAEPAERFMGMADVVGGTPPPPPPPAAPAAWPDDAFKARLPKWQKAVDNGSGHEEIIQFAESKGLLSEEQKAAIRAIRPTAVAEPKAATAPVQAPAPAAVAVTFAQVADGIRLATTLEQLAVAADLIGEVSDPTQRAELTAQHDVRQFDLS